MESLIQKHFPIESISSEDKCSTLIDYEEANALRYSAGYVIRSLTKKLLKSTHNLKEELVLCLQEVIEGTKLLQFVNNIIILIN